MAWPTRVREGDLGILVHEVSGSSPTIAAPSGWVSFPGSPVVDLADVNGSKLSVFWRFAQSDQEANVTVAASNDHSSARIHSFRGVRTSVSPGRAIATATKPTASAQITWPSIETLAHNTTIMFIASRPDDSASTTTFTFFTNSNLDSITLGGEFGTTNGNGGGFAVFFARKINPGPTGTSAANLSTPLTNAMFVIGLEPSNALPA